NLLNHTHHEEPFDDFERQPLLPHKLSQNGPGVSWFDLNSDGWDDLLIGSGKGGKMAVFLNKGGKTFEPIDQPPFDSTLPRDQSTILALHAPTAGSVRILSGSASYEDGDTNAPCVLEYALSSSLSPQAAAQYRFPGLSASVGPMA